MAIFNSYVSHYQRVFPIQNPSDCRKNIHQAMAQVLKGNRCLTFLGLQDESVTSPLSRTAKDDVFSQSKIRETLWVNSHRTMENHGKSPFLMGKSTISMAIFNNKLLVYQRVNPQHVQLL
jgi:hypothetical protein